MKQRTATLGYSEGGSRTNTQPQRRRLQRITGAPKSLFWALCSDDTYKTRTSNVGKLMYPALLISRLSYGGCVPFWICSMASFLMLQVRPRMEKPRRSPYPRPPQPPAG